ncbi:MAG: uracil-DNA glycosylase family protein [Alphaproteobacteria bacterium]|nr:uracil-DNA glycosylase family protein [Alphaproteobacteria bacterium]
MSLEALLHEVRACRLCAPTLDPRPVLRLSPRSRVLVVGQAPGARVHASGLPWDDASGDHLRAWLAVDRPTFDDPDRFGILPMGLCYPGKGRSGDKPPPPVCAETWHARLRALLPQVQLTLLVGRYAQARYLGARAKPTLTETVRAFLDYGPAVMPLPHPSWRSRGWMQRNPWFEAEVLPVLRGRVGEVLGAP